MSVEQKKDIGAEIAKLAKNSKVEELSKKVTEVSSELAENVSEVAERAEKILVVGEDEPLERPASDRVKATVPRTPCSTYLTYCLNCIDYLGHGRCFNNISVSFCYYYRLTACSSFGEA